MHLRRVTVFAIGVVVLLSAACGSSSNTQPAACSLLSPAQLTELTGLSFAEGRSVDTANDQGCVWVANDRQGEVSVVVVPDSKTEFSGRESDAAASFGAAAPIEIAGATNSVEFGDFGVVLMDVKGRVIQVQQSLPVTLTPTIHRDLAAAAARNAS